MSTLVDPQVRVNWHMRTYKGNVIRIVVLLAAVHAVLGFAGSQGWADDFTWSLMFRSFLIIAGAVIVFSMVMAPMYRERKAREETARVQQRDLDAHVQQAAQTVVETEETVAEEADVAEEEAESDDTAEVVAEEVESAVTEPVSAQADEPEEPAQQ